MATYYLDGNTLANSAAVYTNVNLTSCAPDGYYSDGVISRQQIGCVLSPAEECAACHLNCDQILIANDTEIGVYSINTDINSTSIGAVVITFMATIGGVGVSGKQPLGVRAIYNNVTYNELSEPAAGYHASASPANFTFISPIVNPACLITGVTFPSVPSFYYDGVSFFTTGATQSISVAASDVSTVNYVTGRMVVPKTTTSLDMLMFEIASLCSSTSEFKLEVSCPISLTGFGISAVYSSVDQNFCNNPIVSTGYNVPVSSPQVYGVPGLFDWVFSDPNGEYVLVDGYYLVQHPSQNYIIEVGNGVVSQLLTCP